MIDGVTYIKKTDKPKSLLSETDLRVKPESMQLVFIAKILIFL